MTRVPVVGTNLVGGSKLAPRLRKRVMPYHLPCLGNKAATLTHIEKKVHYEHLFLSVNFIHTYL